MFLYTRIEIDEVFLTSDGTGAGVRYIARVDGLLALRLAASRLIVEAADGTPNVQYRTHKGLPIRIEIPTLPTAKLEELLTAINAAEALDAGHSLKLSGGRGDFDLTCELESLEDSGEEIGAGLKGVTIVFRIRTVNEEE